MKLRSTLSAVALCLTLASCGGFFSKPNEKGTPVTLADKTAGDALRVKENKGKRFAATGYLTYIPPMNVYVNRPQAVYLQNTPDSPTVVVVDMPWGQDANNVFMPEGASRDKENVVVYDNDKKPHKLSEKLLVSFEYDPDEVWFQKPRVDPAP